MTPSVTELHQAEQQIAEWLAWEEIENSGQFKEIDDFQQKAVRDKKRETFKDAQTAVKNAYELALYVEKDGSIQTKKITLGAQSLIATLLQETALRIFREKIDAGAIMPNGLYPVWPASDPMVRVSDLYQQFGRDPRLPKLLSEKTVLNTIEDAVRRGVLAVRCVRSDQSEAWFWRSGIDVADWWKNAEAWPLKAFLDSLNAALAQGYVHRAAGGGPISSLQHDGSVELIIRSETPKPQEPPITQTAAGRRTSTLAVLTVSEIQDLAERIHTLSKPLAGMNPQIEVRITVKTNADGDLSEANTILDKIKPGWRL